VNDFARTLGVPVVEDMDVDDLPANRKLKGFNAVQKKVKDIMREGYSASQTLSQLHDIIILHPTLPAQQKAKCALAFAEADKALCDGADEELWVLEVGLRIHKAVT
jgi:replication factor C subunit 2/4